MTNLASKIENNSTSKMEKGMEEIEAGRSLWQDASARLFKNKMAVFGIVYLSFQILLAIFAPFIAPFPYDQTDLILGAIPPDGTHLLGTDDLGRDMFTRILFGARVSLAVGFLATLVSMVIGVTYGAISGFMGGRIDNLMMRALEVLYAMPFTFFVIILMVLFGRNIYLMFVALGAIQWLSMARIVRGQVVSLKKMEYVEAARSMGVKNHNIILRHILPNVMGPVIIYVTLTIPVVILEEAFLSFLGLGVQEPMSSWGTLISTGVSAMEPFPWMLIYPCVTLMVTLLALNFLGDGLRDALDPKASKN
ncbi:MAG: ABC transporter permease [Oligoflexales bacterium]